MKITLVQSNLEWQQAEVNREILAGMLAQSVTETDLILLPEMFTSAFSVGTGAIPEPWPGDSVDWMQSVAVNFDAAVCGSIAVEEDGQRYNRLVFISPEGNLAYYDKRHMFRMLGEHKRYQAGTERAVLSWRGWRILPLICYDLRFPVWSRNTPDLAYDLLLYVANWPGERNYHWQTLLKARAIENLAYVAGVNRIGKDGNGIDYSGRSMLIDPTGEVLLDAGEKAGTFTLTIDKPALENYRESFPAHMDADEFELK